MLELEPDMFGAVGDGVTDDRAAFQAAFDFLVDAGGGRLMLTGSRTYYLGTLGTAIGAIECTDLTNVTIEGNGALLMVDTTANVSAAILKLTNASNVRIVGVRFFDTGSDFSVNWHAANAVQLVASGGSGESSGVALEDCVAEDCLALLMVSGDSGHRLKGISVRDCRALSCFYGVVCQNNGDGLRVSGLYTTNAKRAYFVYGITDHDVELTLDHDGTTAGQDAACLIKCYDQDTSGVRLRARFMGSVAQHTNGVCLEHQRASGAYGTISDIDLDVNIDAPGAMYPVRFRSYLDSGGGTTEQSSTGNMWDRIKIRGNLATTGQEPITFGALTSQGIVGRLVLAPDVILQQSRQPHYPGFVVSTVHGKEFRTLKGTITGVAVAFPFQRLESYPFELIVTTWVQGNLADLALAKRTYRRDLLFCQNVAAVNVAIPSQQNLANYNYNGTAATITYGGTADDLTVTITGSDYGGSNALARIEVEYISRGP